MHLLIQITSRHSKPGFLSCISISLYICIQQPSLKLQATISIILLLIHMLFMEANTVSLSAFHQTTIVEMREFTMTSLSIQRMVLIQTSVYFPWGKIACGKQ